MPYQEYRPCAALQDTVRCFWSIEEDHRARVDEERVTPDSAIELIFILGDPCLHLSYAGAATSIQTLERLPPVFAIGLQTRPFYFQTVGLTRVIGVRAYPWSAPLFTDLRVLPVDQALIALGGEWLSLADALSCERAVKGYPAAVALLQSYLCTRLTCYEPFSASEPDHLQAIIRDLYQTPDSLPIAALAHNANRSVRQLERQFSALTGVAPKTLTRLIRFESAARRLIDRPDSRLIDLAYEFGYTDQAHFIRDFQAFAHRTPRMLLEEVMATHAGD